MSKEKEDIKIEVKVPEIIDGSPSKEEPTVDSFMSLHHPETNALVVDIKLSGELELGEGIEISDASREIYLNIAQLVKVYGSSNEKQLVEKISKYATYLQFILESKGVEYEPLK